MIAVPAGFSGIVNNFVLGAWRMFAGGEYAFAEEIVMSKNCSHLDTIRKVKPSARGCEECLKTGSPWVHLRICRTCGHVGCCNSSPNRHATAHFHETHHPIIEGYDPPEGWGWCYRDEVFIDLGTDTTPQDGPIPRFY